MRLKQLTHSNLTMILTCLMFVGVDLAWGQCPQVAKLTSPHAASSVEQLGYSVAISGNLAVVGSWTEGDGEVCFYQFDGMFWNQKSKFAPTDAAAGDQFGRAVDISGKVAVIAARANEDHASNSGSIYVYRDTGFGWHLEAQLSASDAKASDRFGASVAIDGDVIVVGADQEGDVASNSGAAYVFRYDGSNWNEEARLTTPDLGSSRFFGRSVSIEHGTVVVGALGDNSAEFFLAFRFEGGVWKAGNSLGFSASTPAAQFVVEPVPFSRYDGTTTK